MPTKPKTDARQPVDGANDASKNDPSKRKLKDVLSAIGRYTSQLPCDPLTPRDKCLATTLPRQTNELSEMDAEAAKAELRRIHATMRSHRTVRLCAYSYAVPEPMPDPAILAMSRSTAAMLAIDPADQDLALAVTATRLPSDVVPYAHNYAGHQFGYFVGQLGDGRCVSLGEISVPIAATANTNLVRNAADDFYKKTHRVSELQLKGAGRTPYARAVSDGHALLRSCTREFLACEYMHAVRVPTTRALALVAGTRGVYREKGLEPGAVIARVAQSWIRFGSFELFWYRGEHHLLKQLADFVISTHYEYIDQSNEYLQVLHRTVRVPLISVVGNELMSDRPESSPATDSPQTSAVKTAVNPITLATEAMNAAGPGGIIGPYRDNSYINIQLNRYARLFKEVVKRSAELCAGWQSVGFIHGLLNTDNMSIHGITLDYGPFMFIDAYDPGICSSSSDSVGRYRFENQPQIVYWNLSKLGRTFVELVELGSEEEDEARPHTVDGKDIIEGILDSYDSIFIDTYVSLMAKKLGFKQSKSSDLEDLILPLLNLLSETETDYCTFFRSLCQIRLTDVEFKNEMGPTANLNTDANEAVTPASYPSLQEFQKLQQELAGSSTAPDHPFPATATNPTTTTRKRNESNASSHSKEKTPTSTVNDKKPSGCIELLCSSVRNAMTECLNEIEALCYVSSAATTRVSVATSGQGKRSSVSAMRGKRRASIAAVGAAVMASLRGGKSGRGGAPANTGRQSVSGKRVSIVQPNMRKNSEIPGGILEPPTLSDGASKADPGGQDDEKADGDSDLDYQLPTVDVLVEGSLHSVDSNKRRSIRLASSIMSEIQQRRKSSQVATPVDDTDASEQDDTFNEHLENQAKVQEMFPTESEVRYRWQDWLVQYRTRLLTEMVTLNPTTAVSPGSIEAEDVKRRTRMQKENPKFNLRGWILEEICDKVTGLPECQPVDAEIDRLQDELRILAEVERRTLATPSKKDSDTNDAEDDMNTELQDLLAKVKRGEPIGDPVTSKKRDRKGQAPSAKIPMDGVEPMNQAIRILIDDIWGDVTDSPRGWESAADKDAAGRWGGKVPKWKDNIIQQSSS
ncbi:hypothetical protein HDU80_003730 [Chytriomyces hyalinus]|nr:hypothetical protein HDU80_003730 [Chytriomyces hyalinus]